MNSPQAKEDGATAPRAHSKSVIFDHEKLDAYQLQLQFITWVTPMIERAKEMGVGKSREVCDQLDRASLSALLNTAEGNGKRQGQVRAKFFDDARGSAMECAACLDALVAKGIFVAEQLIDGKAMLLRVVSMLCGLVDRFDHSPMRLHEEAVEYRIVNDGDWREKTRTRTRTRTKTNRRRL